MSDKSTKRMVGQTTTTPAVPGSDLETVVDEILAAHPEKIEEHHTGLPAIGYLVGQVMQATRGHANASAVQATIRSRLEDQSDRDWDRKQERDNDLIGRRLNTSSTRRPR